MAKYEIKDAEIKKIEKGQNKGQEYLVGTLEDTTSFYAQDRKFVSFLDRVVKAWKAILPTSKGGTAENETPVEQIPEKMRFIYGVFANYIPNCEHGFVKKYLTDTQKNVNGALVNIKAGETVKDKDGNPIIYDKLRVFCQYALVENEETNKIERVFLPGQSVEEVGQRLFSVQCASVVKSNTPAIAETPNPDDEPIPPHSGLEAKTIIGYDPKTGEPIYG